MTYTLLCSQEKLYFLMKKKTWVKKCSDEDVDVPMGCYDWSEICELVGS